MGGIRPDPGPVLYNYGIEIKLTYFKYILEIFLKIVN